MASPRTEWRKAVIAKLSDGEWHPAGAVFAAVADLIPAHHATPYMARRRGQPQVSVNDLDAGRWSLFDDYLRRELCVLRRPAAEGNLPLIRLSPPPPSADELDRNQFVSALWALQLKDRLAKAAPVGQTQPVAEQGPARAQKKGGGRPPEHDWDGFWIEVVVQIYSEGIEDRRELQKHMMKLFPTLDERAVRRKLARLYAREQMRTS